LTDPAGKACPAENRNRAAGVGQPDTATEKENHVLAGVLTAAATSATTTAAAIAARTELKYAGVFEEEVPLFGKEQVKPRQVDLLLVGLDLREIGVEREVPRETRCDAVLHVEAGIEIAPVGRDADPVCAGEGIRLHAQVGAGPQSFKTLECAG
jgi:hypothetical protein